MEHRAGRSAIHAVPESRGHERLGVRVHYTEGDLPQVIESSGGRYAGLIFAPTAGEHGAQRLTQVLELTGKHESEDRFATSRVLVEYRYSAAGDLTDVIDDQGQVVRTFAWQNHILVEHAEPGGVVSRYEWDQANPKGRVLRNTLSTGEVLTFTYVEAEGYNRVTDASGRATTYYYDAEQRYTGITDPAGATNRFVRDAHDNLLSVTDALGRTTRNSYDGDGNRIRIERPDGSVYRLVYHPTLRKVVALIDPLNRTTSYDYDARGNLIRTEAPDGAVTEYRLNTNGLPVSIVDARGGVSMLEYDTTGRLATYRDCLGQPTHYAYDDSGNLLRVTDAQGNTTHYRYQRINRRERLIAITHADGAVERYAYDTLGRLIAHHDPLGNVTKYTLDAEGKPLVRENALGHLLRYQYDVHGHLLALTNENGALYRFAWDAADRLIAEQGFDGRRIDYRYNHAGELIESADGVLTKADSFGYGQTGIVRTRYRRDAMGRLLAKLSSKPQGSDRPQISHSRFVYNATGELVQARNASARVELHYTAMGQLAREITRTRGGQASTLAHTYDGMGNRLSTTLSDGRVLTNTLYGSGHVSAITPDEDTICEFERDTLHRETVRKQGALSSYYEHDPVGRLLRQHVKGNTAPHGTQTEPKIARHYHYDRAGQLLKVDDTRKGSTTYQYDRTGRLLIAHAPHATETFAFDPASNLLDPRQQDQNAKSPSTKKAWTDEEWSAFVRDNLDNPHFNPLLTPEQMAAEASQWTEQKPNRLLVWQDHRYRYDAWGNCVEKKSGPHETRTFQWDAEHQLTHANVQRMERGRLVNERCGYDYDPFGRRIAKYWLDTAANDDGARQRNTRTHFTWDGNRLLQERKDEEQLLYLYEPNSFIPLALVRSERRQERPEKTIELPAQFESLKDRYPEQWAAIERRTRRLETKAGAEPVKLRPNAEPGGAEIFYVHADHLGTPKELTNRDGHLVWAATYKAWGKATIELPSIRARRQVGSAMQEAWEEQTHPISQNLRFQGQYFDEETGLHYNRFRYYDPDCGRFLSQDLIGLAGGANSYRYAPNPVQFIDPSGLRCKGLFNSFKKFTLPAEKLFASDAVQFRLANKNLIPALENNLAFRRDMFGRYPGLSDWLKNPDMSKSPAGLTWHHADETGVRELVDRSDHVDNHGIYHPDGRGGRERWGGGKDGRTGKLDPKTGCS